MTRWVYSMVLLFLSAFAWAAPSGALIPLEHVEINLKNKASLQRGAKLYINYCSGCHSLRFLRYNRMAKDLGISNPDGSVNAALVEDNLIFTGARISDPILTAMPEIDARQWFGIAPPDLTLIARIRGTDWIYTFLKSFYADPERLFGVNNLVYVDVAMPNVLAALQGIQELTYQETAENFNGGQDSAKIIDHLKLVEEGSMSPAEFDAAIRDIVNFLAYASTPEKVQRESIGVWVLLFMFIFAIAAYLLKREYWKNVKRHD